MQEIHAIQKKLYEETKGLSHRQHIAKTHKEAEEVIRKHGLSFRRPSEVK